MKLTPHLSAAAALLLGLFVTGCETDGGVSARAQEKSAVYTALKPWQKRLIDKGTIAAGFTPDMVYLALGNADKVETKELPEGTAEMWVYTHYYPNVDAIHGFRHADFTTESAYQPQRALEQTKSGFNPFDYKSPKVPLGMDVHGDEDISKTGGPQGGSMEPANLRSYTIKVLFASGKVVRIGADENMN